MKLTNNEIYLAVIGDGNEVKNPFKQLTDCKLPIKVGWELVKLSHQLDAKSKLILEMKDKLIRDFGEEKDGQLSVQAGSPKWNDFAEAFNTLMSQEVEIDFDETKKISIPTKGNDGKDIEIKPITLFFLEKFVEVV